MQTTLAIEAPEAPPLAEVWQIPVVSCRLVKERTQDSPSKRVRSAVDVYELARRYMDGLDRESFVVLLLNTQNQIVGINTVTVGTLDASLVHPREVFKPAILASAASIILVHNHPSGDPTPSAEDRSVTRQLRTAGALIGIDVLDHVVIGEGRYVSFAESGLLE
jgi:DNA repair protein RadC